MGKSLLITVPLPPAAEPAVGMLVEPGEGQSQAGLLQHRAGGKAPADAALVAPDRKESDKGQQGTVVWIPALTRVSFPCSCS